MVIVIYVIIMDKLNEDLLMYVYNLIPIIDRASISKTDKFFTELFKNDLSKIIKIQRAFRKNRISDDYDDYINFSDHIMHRYYMAKYESKHLLSYPEFLTNKAIRQMDKRENAFNWINENLDKDANKRRRKDIYRFFKENNITSQEIVYAGW